MKIIAFGHRKRVGKDLCAKILISHLRVKHKNLNIVKAGFADKLKAVAYDLYKHLGLMPADFYEDHPEFREMILPFLGKTPRQVYIDLGNGIRDRVYNATWYEYLLMNTQADLLVIKDMRFPVEAEGILAKGGQIYRVDRDCIQQDFDGADDPLINFDKWTGVISNNGTIHELHSKVISIAETLFP